MGEHVKLSLTAEEEPEVLALFRRCGASRLGRHSDFWTAAARHAEGTLAQYDRHSAALRWLTRDIGRTAVLSRMVMRDAEFGRVTVSDLLTVTLQHNTSSGGRVRQVIQRAEKAGLICIAPGNEPWSQRRLLIKSELIESFRERAAVEIGAAAIVSPEILPTLDRLRDDGFFRRFLANLAVFDAAGPRLRGPPTPSIRLFLQREGGMAMLRDLFLRQSARRSRLLESAPFSRQALARRTGTSRAHVARVFAQAELNGHLSLVDPRDVLFSPQMSDEFGWHLAATFQVVGACALAAAC